MAASSPSASRQLAQPVVGPQSLRATLHEFIWWVLAATMATWKNGTAYLINVIRWPVWPMTTFLVSWIAYRANGQTVVAGAGVASFLFVGVLGQMSWSNSIWWSGASIDNERNEGTIAALFMSPANRVAIVTGHGLAGLLMLIPSLVVLSIVGALAGVRFSVGSPAVVTLAILTMLVTTIGAGLGLAALFILTRRANLFANVIQHPIYLLGGFIVPRERFPDWMYAISQAVPTAHAVDALRSALLHSGTWSDVRSPLLAALGLATFYALLGVAGLRRIEHVARNSGELDLY